MKEPNAYRLRNEETGRIDSIIKIDIVDSLVRSYTDYIYEYQEFQPVVRDKISLANGFKVGQKYESEDKVVFSVLEDMNYIKDTHWLPSYLGGVQGSTPPDVDEKKLVAEKGSVLCIDSKADATISIAIRKDTYKETPNEEESTSNADVSTENEAPSVVEVARTYRVVNTSGKIIATGSTDSNQIIDIVVEADEKYQVYVVSSEIFIYEIKYKEETKDLKYEPLATAMNGLPADVKNKLLDKKNRPKYHVFANYVTKVTTDDVRNKLRDTDWAKDYIKKILIVDLATNVVPNWDKPTNMYYDEDRILSSYDSYIYKGNYSSTVSYNRGEIVFAITDEKDSEGEPTGKQRYRLYISETNNNKGKNIETDFNFWRLIISLKDECMAYGLTQVVNYKKEIVQQSDISLVTLMETAGNMVWESSEIEEKYEKELNGYTQELDSYIGTANGYVESAKEYRDGTSVAKDNTSQYERNTYAIKDNGAKFRDSAKEYSKTASQYVERYISEGKDVCARKSMENGKSNSDLGNNIFDDCEKVLLPEAESYLIRPEMSINLETGHLEYNNNSPYLFSVDYETGKLNYDWRIEKNG